MAEKASHIQKYCVLRFFPTAGPMGFVISAVDMERTYYLH
jgi:hypothetical protein